MVPELSAEEREWVLAQRRAQGLPDKLEDQDAIDRIAAIFRAARREQATRHQGRPA